MHVDVKLDSVWSIAPESSQGLTQDAQADVCVVGAGIAGLSVAYRLGLEGKRVLVLDDGPVAGGQTGRTTAHLASAIDDRFTEMERIHGQEESRLAGQSHAAAIDFIEQTVTREKIDCFFDRVDGYLFVPPGEPTDLLDREQEAARRAGLAVEKLPRAPLPSFDTGPCLRFARQGQFDPLRYLHGLTQAIGRAGGQILTGAHVRSIEGGKPARIETADGRTVTADAVVVATNTPINDRVAIHTKQAPYVTLAIALRMPRNAIPKALYWDTADPYHYVRLLGASGAGEDLLIVGGEDYKTGQAHDQEERFRRLEAWARERFPMAGERASHWTGQVMETVDGLGFIGKNPGDADNVFIATGDSGMGMTHGTLAGLLLTDLILGRANPWAALYDPARKRLHALGEFLRENVNVALQYGAWVTGGDVASTDEVARDAGAVLRQGLHKLAVYRDGSAALHTCSATCPHLGGIVTWNDAEKTWDCPLHGSRFDCHGRVINGPANVDLKPATESAHQ